jgi:cytochrome P450
VTDLESKIRERVTSLLEGVVDQGECDVMSDLASPLVVHMIGVGECGTDPLQYVKPIVYGQGTS